MNLLIAYYLMYFFTYVGFPLGKVTKYEHKEIYKKVKILTDIVIVLFYIVFMLILGKNWFFLIIPLLLFHLFITWKNVRKLHFFHNLLFFPAVFFISYLIVPQFLFLSLIPVFVLVVENSFKPLDKKKEILTLASMTFFYFVFFFAS